MSTALGFRFVHEVRDRFAAFYHRYGFREVGVDDNLSFASVTAKNDTHYLRISCDFRDSFIDVALGKLAEGVVPPIPLAPPRSASEVREIPGAIIVWLATGNKHAAFGLFEYTTAESLDNSVEGAANALMKHGSRILAGDQSEWDRAAELTVTREWRPD